MDHSQIALLSFFSPDYQPLHDVNGPNKQEYCNHHNYRHIVKLSPYKEPDLYYAFDRLYYIYDLFFNDLEEGRGIEFILVLNGHAQVMNHNIEIESLIDNDHDFYVSKDVNGLNLGVFIIRKSDWSKKWLEHILSYKDTHKQYHQFEQTIIQENADHPDFRDRIKILPQRSINSYFYSFYYMNVPEGDFQTGDFILHIPGRSVLADPNDSLLESRIKIFQSNKVLNLIIKTNANQFPDYNLFQPQVRYKNVTYQDMKINISGDVTLHRGTCGPNGEFLQIGETVYLKSGEWSREEIQTYVPHSRAFSERH